MAALVEIPGHMMERLAGIAALAPWLSARAPLRQLGMARLQPGQALAVQADLQGLGTSRLPATQEMLGQRLAP